MRVIYASPSGTLECFARSLDAEAQLCPGSTQGAMSLARAMSKAHLTSDRSWTRCGLRPRPDPAGSLPRWGVHDETWKWEVVRGREALDVSLISWAIQWKMTPLSQL